jgi:cell division protein FtsQ
MLFRSKKNRRKVDLARKTGEFKAAARHHAPAFLTVFGLVAGSVLVMWGAWEGLAWARTSPRFALREVTVSGHEAAADVELVRLAGLALGQNLVAMDVAAMERAISTHPWVKAVTVTRHLPDRVSIEVTEHRAVALLSFGELYVVNEAGRPFKRLKAGDEFDLPLITGLDRDAFVDGRAEEDVRGALEVADAWAAHEDLEKEPLSEIHLSDEGVTAVTQRGLEVRLGSGDVAAKLARLARVQKALHARALVAEVIRLDNRARPAWVAVQVAAKGP